MKELNPQHLQECTATLPWTWQLLVNNQVHHHALTDACQEAFEKLKEEFQKAPVLLMPDSTKPFIIESDAFKFATGAVIQQKNMNGNYHPCGYISHSFNAIQ